jgi:hypothetical protein
MLFSFQSFEIILKLSTACGFIYFIKEAYKYKKTMKAIKEMNSSINIDFSNGKVDPNFLNKNILIESKISKLSNSNDHKEYYSILTYLDDEYNQSNIIKVNKIIYINKK